MEILLLHHNPMYSISFSLILLPSIFAAAAYDTDPLSYALFNFKSQFLVVDDSDSNSYSNSDSQILKDWFLPTNFRPTSSGIYACSWTGVQCAQNSSKLISLDLSGKNLAGSLSDFAHFNLFSDLVHLNLSHNSFSGHLPASIFNLTTLTTLDISRNNFSGHFPPGISNLRALALLDAFSNSFSGFLPPEVSQIDSLKTLNFAGSYFRGPIPPEYGRFRAIEFIHLAGNFLTGQIPSELGNLQTLSHMEIGYNSYGGAIPWQFGNMSGLKYLDIADANISGPIPKALGNLSSLESLFLFRNQLSGRIPSELSFISTLQSLDLSDNLISGSIPDALSELKNLRLLSLMYNYLSGPVPQGIADLPFLDTLLIWSNYFNGSLPEGLGRFSKLKHLDVSTNYFVGVIPPGICAGGELEKLILFSNNFTGGLSPSLSDCSSLVRVRIEDNLFSGEISMRFSDLPHISYVDLSRNKFVGGVSPDIDQASTLEYFNVSYNPDLGGTLPVKIWSLPNLRNFSMVSCGLSANIPPFENCESITLIELRKNNLSGNIPESVSDCKQLSILDLASNNLSGPIPAKLGDASSTLRLVNVSYNDLSGSIPSNPVFKKMEQSAFLGNPKLCGSPLRPCEDGISNGFELRNRRAQRLAWTLILCGAVVLFVTAAAFGILYFKKGSKARWRVIAFIGLPQFKAKDVLRSFNYDQTLSSSALPDSIDRVVLPTGITVSAKKIEWDPKEMEVTLQNLTRIGNVRHGNLRRLLGICYNNNVAYLLHDYMANGNLGEKVGVRLDWESKCRLLIKVARALCFLHHDCCPAISHGNLKAHNVVFDEKMEPHLAEYGLNGIVEWSHGSLPVKIRKEMTGVFQTSIMDEIQTDVYDFGELILDVLTNGRLVNASEINTHKEDVLGLGLMREVARENGIDHSRPSHEEVKAVIEVALLCTRVRPSDRPSMQVVVLKLISGLKSVGNDF